MADNRVRALLRRWFYAARAFTEGPPARRYRKRFGAESFGPDEIARIKAWHAAHPEYTHRMERDPTEPGRWRCRADCTGGTNGGHHRRPVAANLEDV